MEFRIRILREHGLGLKEIQGDHLGSSLCRGAREFWIDWGEEIAACDCKRYLRAVRHAPDEETPISIFCNRLTVDEKKDRSAAMK